MSRRAIIRLSWQRVTANCYSATLYDWVRVSLHRKRNGMPWRIEMAGMNFFEDWRIQYDDLDDAKHAAEKKLVQDVCEAYRIISVGRALEST